MRVSGVMGCVARAYQGISAKTEAKKPAAQKAIEGLVPQIKGLYKKALEYMKENALDLEKEKSG